MTTLESLFSSETAKTLDVEGGIGSYRLVLRKNGKVAGDIFVAAEELQEAVSASKDLDPIIEYANSKGITMDYGNPGRHSVNFVIRHLGFLESQVARLEAQLEEKRSVIEQVKSIVGSADGS